jgi:hypothetical protein
MVDYRRLLSTLVLFIGNIFSSTKNFCRNDVDIYTDIKTAAEVQFGNNVYKTAIGTGFHLLGRIQCIKRPMGPKKRLINFE